MTHELWVLSAIFGALVVLIFGAHHRESTLNAIATTIKSQGSTLDTIKDELVDINSTLSTDR